MKRRRQINSASKQLRQIIANQEKLIQYNEMMEARRWRKIREALKPFLSGDQRRVDQEANRE